MDKKLRLLDLNAKAYEIEQTFIASLSGEERSELGAFEHWCAKDVIAHNASWRTRMAENLLNAAQGKLTQGVEDYNHENARFYQEHCTKTWEQVLIYANQAYLALGEQVSALSESALEDTELLPWQEGRPLWRLLIGNGYLHPVIHVSEYHRNRGRKQVAAGLLEDSIRQCQDFDDSPSWQGVVHYNLACQYALLGEQQSALKTLRLAFSLYPSLVEYSQTDTDLASLRGLPEYQALVAERPE
jgi:tetratricopeptide (TPR) repeat protein